MPVWAAALDWQFLWSRSQFSTALVITYLTGLAAPLEGYLSDRFGPRRMVLTGLGILAAGFLFFGTIQSLWSFYAAFAIMTAGHSLGIFIPLTVMLSRWFVRRRATAIAISQMAAPLSAMFLVPFMSWSADPDTGTAGWHLTAFAAGGLILLAATLVYFGMRNRPRDMGLLPDGGHTPDEWAREPGFSTAQALRTHSFWLIAIGGVLLSIGLSTALSQLGLKMQNSGLDLAQISFILSVQTTVAPCFYLVGSLAGDRISKSAALAIFAVLQAMGIVAFALADGLLGFLLAAVILGMGAGYNPLIVAILPDYFGTVSLGKILGIFLLVDVLISVLSSYLTLPYTFLYGFSYVFPENYILRLLPAAGLTLLGAFLFLKARPPQLPETDMPQTLPDQETGG